MLKCQKRAINSYLKRNNVKQKITYFKLNDESEKKLYEEALKLNFSQFSKDALAEKYEREKNIDCEIELLNAIIREATIDGGDGGGPYLGNREKLEKSINNFLEFRNLEDKFCVIKTIRNEYTENEYDEIMKIVKRDK